MMHREIALSAGTVEYEDSGGNGRVVVLLPGLLMDATLWSAVVARLAPKVRCVVPTLPLGAHRLPMVDGADLTLPGQARIVAELLAALDLEDVTLVGNDTGGAIVQLVAGDPQLRRRVDRIVLVSCEAFDNLPPGLTGKTVVLTGRLPAPLFGLFMQQMRIKLVRRLPIAFGWLTKRGDATVAGWVSPVLNERDIRRDAVRVLRGIRAGRHVLVENLERLATFEGPALIVWAAEDRVMPPKHGRRLADLLRGELVQIDDSYTLIPLDQPTALAGAIERFVGARLQQSTLER